MTIAVPKQDPTTSAKEDGRILRVAVIGSGLMGAGIAAHCANAGCDVVLMDIVPDGAEDPDVLPKGAIKNMLKANPEVLMHPDFAERITPANLDDSLHLLADRDWVIEVVIERLDIKRDVYAKLAEYMPEHAILSSNTSTLPRSKLVAGMPSSLSSRFLITHFFNPPRYLPLLEVVTSKEVPEETLQRFTSFADEKLGKRVTLCNDTPGFIGNRLGIYFVQRAIAATLDHGFTVEQADAMLGRPIGLPKTGVFALMDLVGIDLVPHVIESMVQHLPKEDALHTIAGRGGDIITAMIEDGYTGRKGKGGFYRLNTDDGQRIKEARDLQTGEYATANRRAAFPSAKIGKQGLARLIEKDDAGSRFVKEILLDTFAYAASLVPVVSADIASIDGAMQVGYNWKKGPFQMMDELGLDWLITELEALDKDVPDFLRLAAENGGFHGTLEGEPTRITTEGTYVLVPRPAATFTVADLKRRQGRAIKRNGSASLWDAGDGVLLVEYHSKLNAMDPNSMEMLMTAVDIAENEGWKGILIGNDGSHFCAGANLGLALFAANLGAWKEVEQFIKLGQDTYQTLKYAEVPVVAAAAGMCVGGGCEVLMHCDAVQAHSESYIGLVEVGVGIIPGWGGCKEILGRLPNFGISSGGPMGAPMQAFENIGLAKVAKSAEQARELGYLRPTDQISMNRDRLLADAKARVLKLAEDYSPPEPHTYHLPGPSGRLALEMALNDLASSGKATPHDVVVVGELAKVLTGGDDADVMVEIGEDEILALERAAIATLAKDVASLDRMEHMLATGKPLRN